MTDNEWPLEADFSDIRPMTPEERKAAQERDERNSKSNDKQSVEEADSREQEHFKETRYGRAHEPDNVNSPAALSVKVR